MLQFVTCLPGQTEHPYGQLINIGEEDQVNVRNSIKKGQNGFVWMATNNGLCRFDGQRFKFYRNDPKDPHSIFSNEAYVVLAIRDEIWVGTSQGVSVLNIHTHRFRNYQLSEDGKVADIQRASQKNGHILIRGPAGRDLGWYEISWVLEI